MSKDFTQIVDNLYDEFNVDGPHDLTPFFTASEQWLYDLLKTHYREAYESNYRLVLYFDTDYYPYINAPGTLMSKLQQYLMDLDISHFFVIIISSDDKIKNDLQELQVIYKNNIRKPDTYPILHITASNITPFSHNYIKRDSTICTKLWNHFHVHTTGEVFPCCIADKRYPLGNIKHNTPTEILDNAYGDIRSAMLNNESIIQCAECYNKEDSGLNSMRIIPDGTLECKVTDFDIRLNNVCNLMCRMCTGSYSSKIAAEENSEFGAEYQTIKTLSTRNLYITDIIDIMDDVESIYFAGGEPLIMNEHYTILRHLINIGKTNVILSYNTNLTILQYKNNNVLELWNKFKCVKIGASLDASYGYAEYIRNGAEWEDIVHNYKKIITLPNVIFSITSNINIYNIFNLMDFQKEWIIKYNISPNDFKMTPLTSPEFLSIQVLPNDYKKQVAESITRHIAFLYEVSNDHSLVELWLKAKQYMFRDDKSFLLPQFFNYTDEKDKIRGESFNNIFDEYIDLRKYCE